MSVSQRRPLFRTDEWSGSVLLGAVYSVAFYIASGLVITLGEGFGGILEFGWVAVAIAWAVVALVFVARPRTRLTGLGMIGSVVVIALVFVVLGWLMSLLPRPA